MLNEIAKYFDQVSVHDLARKLLEKHPGGGIRFIRQHTATSGPTNWAFMALMVLIEWCDHSQTKVFGGDLFTVLKEICPDAARNFREKLLGFA